jgi:hypothetical protein
MKVKKINAFHIKPPRNCKGAFAHQTKPEEIKLHKLFAAVGMRGAGKTLAMMNKIQTFYNDGHCQRLFIISPTYQSNKAIYDMVKHSPADVYIEPTRESLQKIIQSIEAEGIEWRAYQEQMKRWKYAMKKRAQQGNANNPFTAQSYDEPERPQYKYDKQPCFHVILDDVQGSPVFQLSSKSPLANFLLRHRHVGGGLGCSVFMNVQTYKSQGGLPRPLRQNLTHLALFKTRDTKALGDIASEVASDIDPDMFLRAYEYATKDPFCFLLVDFSPKEPQYRFRKNFNVLIILSDDEQQDQG